MTPEQTNLRLGLAGFTADQQESVHAALQSRPPSAAAWEIVPFTEADAWWVHGARTVPMPDGTLRVNPGKPSGRSVLLDLSDIDRPLAFARPVPAAPFDAASFDLEDPVQVAAMLDRFSGWLQPLTAQFCLAASLLEQHAALGTGSFHVLQGPQLIAVVNMRGDAGVLPTATTVDFEEALWRRSPQSNPPIPEQFARLSLSQLMWQFAQRSTRDLLPPHYRTGLLYFRRPPRLPQRLMRDAHLLLLRELATGCGTMEELQARTGMASTQISRDLAALYLVGAITSNPKRAAAGATKRLETNDSLLSAPPSLPSAAAPRAGPVNPDLTAPAPLRNT